MLRGRSTLPPLLLVALCCAPSGAKDWSAPSSSLRIFEPHKSFVALAHDEPLPEVVPEIEERPPEELAAEATLVGGDLAETPNLYEETEHFAEPDPHNAVFTDPRLKPPPEWPQVGELAPPPQPQYDEYGSPPPGQSFFARPQPPQLQRESWLNRPYNVSFFLGGMFLDNPLPGTTDGEPGFMYGGRLGWDFSPYFGVETRIAGADPGLRDPAGVADLPPAEVFLWDLNWLYYWTGDTRWRPYFLVGTGLFQATYLTATENQNNTTFELPFGVGVKYRHSTRWAMRFDLIDNFTFASGRQAAMHNLSITAGLEARFGGGMRRNYWPWNPGRDWR